MRRRDDAPEGAPLHDRRWILFDAGGTLISLDYDRIRELLTDACKRPSDDELDRAEALARRWADAGLRRRLSTRELWDGYFRRLLEGAGAHPTSLDEALNRLWLANREQGLWRRPVPGAHGVLSRLAASGRRLAVVSNAEGQVEADLSAAGFGELLETVVDSHLVGVAKPDPRIFEIALARLGARANDAAYVGDVPAFDVDGARAAGIAPILLDPHGIHQDVDAVTIRSLGELPGLLLS